jgi:hypothetical protein
MINSAGRDQAGRHAARTHKDTHTRTHAQSAALRAAKREMTNNSRSRSIDQIIDYCHLTVTSTLISLHIRHHCTVAVKVTMRDER